MRKRVGMSLCVVALLLMPLSAAAQSDTVFIRSGPDAGEVQVSAPWGDYVVYDEGGGAYWVGTQREYDRQRVIGIAREHGERVSTVNVDGADATFVPVTSFRTHAGDIPFDNIDPEVMYRINPRSNPPRPRIPSTSDYVSLSWIQSLSNPAPQTLLYDLGTKTTYHPYYSGNDGSSQFASEFAVPRARTTRPMLIFFIVAHRSPGVVAIHSLTSATYASDKASIAQDRSYGISSNPDTTQEIADLERIDHSLTHHTRAAAPASVAATAAPATVAASASQWSGEIVDARGGRGHIILNFDGTGGRFAANFCCNLNNFGVLENVVRGNSGRITFVMSSQRAAGCDYAVDATVDGANLMQGRYSGCGSNSGTFTLHAGP